MQHFKKGRLIFLMVLAVVLLSATMLLTMSLFTPITAPLPNVDERVYNDDPVFFRFIEPSVIETWGARKYFVVFGIPSVDVPGREWRRRAQRSTCWKYPNVATKENNFTGEMLVLYVIGRHQSHKYMFSKNLEEEALKWQDVITLPMNEGRENVRVKSKYLEKEVGMSRKTYLWYRLALRLFPTLAFIVKADDDIFLRVPQYLNDLHTLPLRGVYWGRVLHDTVMKGWRKIPFSYIGGYCSTTSRDVAEQLVLSETLEFLSVLPYDKRKIGMYLRHKMDHEDRMVGLALTSTRYPLFIVSEPLCRFHYVSDGNHSALNPMYFSPMTENSVVIHHPTEKHYILAKEMFHDNNVKAMPFTLTESPEGFTDVKTATFACFTTT